MAKVEKDPFRCSECGWTSQKWVGRCGECQAWGSVEELAAPKKLSLVPGRVTHAATPIGDVDLSSAQARATGVSELDRVLGGGLVPGAAILLAGEPGVGKSTLYFQLPHKQRRRESLRSTLVVKSQHHRFDFVQSALTQLTQNSFLHQRQI